MRNKNINHCIKKRFTSEEQELLGYKQHDKKEVSVEPQVKAYEYSQPEIMQNIFVKIEQDCKHTRIEKLDAHRVNLRKEKTKIKEATSYKQPKSTSYRTLVQYHEK